MTKLPSCHFAIKSNGILKRLFKVGLRKNGDLVLSIQRAEMLRSIGSNINEEKITQQKYSLHTSRESKTGINVIKHELLADGVPQNDLATYHYTKVIKNKINFAPVFFKRCPDFIEEHYTLDGAKIPKKDTLHLLDELNTETTTLFYSVAFADKDCVFDESRKAGINLFQKIIGDYRIIVFWIFMPLYPTRLGALSHVQTTNDNKHSIENGWSENQYLTHFKDCYANAQAELLSITISEMNSVLPNPSSPECLESIAIITNILHSGDLFIGKDFNDMKLVPIDDFIQSKV